MPHPPLARRVAALGVAAVVLSGLSGCFLLPGAGDRGAPSQSSSGAANALNAAEGDCWQASIDDLIDWSTWEGGGPVDCDDEHQSYSFFVGELETEVEDAWNGNGMSDDLARAISDQCYPLLDDLLGSNERLQRISLFFFVTPRDVWEAGEHLVRCDLALTALGSDYYDPDIADLRGSLDEFLAQVEDDPRAFELCLLADGIGPYESYEASYADCSADYDFRFAGTVEFDAEPGAEYPADDVLADYAEDECAALGPEGDETVLFYPPLLELWEAGSRTIECWFSLSTASAPPDVV